MACLSKTFCSIDPGSNPVRLKIESLAEIRRGTVKVRLYLQAC
jgi:hypothetical protein